MEFADLVHAAGMKPLEWAREPLVQFLALGALVFVAHGLLASEAGEDRRILVTEADMERMAAVMAAELGRPPDAFEIQGLVASHVREEALYREALRLGLNEGDTIVRRRLAQKMEFMLEAADPPDPPSQAELEDWFAENLSQFRQPARRSFSHIFFSPELRGQGVMDDATKALAQLHPEAWRDAGDPFMLQSNYVFLTPGDVAKLFGSIFSDALFEITDTGVWVGPIGSALGVHLVRIDARREARSPPFDEIRPMVVQAWQEQALRKENAQRVRDLIDQYEVDIRFETS